MEIPASGEDHMELTPPRGDFSTHASPLVQLPPTTDVSVHPSLEGHGDTSTPPDYGLDAPFGRLLWANILPNLGLLDLHQEILPWERRNRE